MAALAVTLEAALNGIRTRSQALFWMGFANFMLSWNVFPCFLVWFILFRVEGLCFIVKLRRFCGSRRLRPGSKKAFPGCLFADPLSKGTPSLSISIFLSFCLYILHMCVYIKVYMYICMYMFIYIYERKL